MEFRSEDPDSIWELHVNLNYRNCVKFCSVFLTEMMSSLKDYFYRVLFQCHAMKGVEYKIILLTHVPRIDSMTSFFWKTTYLVIETMLNFENFRRVTVTHSWPE